MHGPDASHNVAGPPTTHEGRLSRFRGVGRREVWAVGDVHGRADLLEEVLGAIASVPVRPGVPRTVVLLGDLVDRGPESVRALDVAMAAAGSTGHEVVTLMGNHEQMLATVVDDGAPSDVRAQAMETWTWNGGVAVLDELGCDATPEAVAEALGPARVAFLKGLPGHWRASGSDVLFVHAGVCPRTPLDTFLARDWRTMFRPGFREDGIWNWIREPFLDHRPATWDKVGHQGMFVVHGHTPMDAIHNEVRALLARDRLNLDLYAVRTGRLRFARFEEDRFEIRMTLQAQGFTGPPASATS